MIKATNIKWNVDSYDELENLLKEIDIPAKMTDPDTISDYLSDKMGFCRRKVYNRELREAVKKRTC